MTYCFYIERQNACKQFQLRYKSTPASEGPVESAAVLVLVAGRATPVPPPTRGLLLQQFPDGAEQMPSRKGLLKNMAVGGEGAGITGPRIYGRH
jgi:hypothetical protein